jgi:hypothetical protein
VTARIQAMLAAQLGEDEQVLWAGRPSAGAFLARNWMLSVVGAFWFVLTLMWIAGVVAGGLPIIFYLVVIPLLAVAGWLTVGHVLWAAIELPNVHYVLTNWRVLMTYGWPQPRVRTIPLSRIAELDFWPRPNGYGDIQLGLELGYWNGARWAKAGSVTWGQHDIVLRGVASCAEVYAQLCRAIRAGGAASTSGPKQPPAI